MEWIFMVLAFAMGAIITRNIIILAQEDERLGPRFFGFSSNWTKAGRASEAWYVFGLPVYARTFNHSTLWLP